VSAHQSDYAIHIKNILESQGIRVEIDSSSEKIGYKVRQGITDKIPYLLILGKREVEENKISLRSRQEGDLGSISVPQFLDKILPEIQHIK
jgi:threonyl-tRNA synthetase